MICFLFVECARFFFVLVCKSSTRTELFFICLLISAWSMLWPYLFQLPSPHQINNIINNNHHQHFRPHLRHLRFKVCPVKFYICLFIHLFFSQHGHLSTQLSPLPFPVIFAIVSSAIFFCSAWCLHSVYIHICFCVCINMQHSMGLYFFMQH